MDACRRLTELGRQLRQKSRAGAHLRADVARKLQSRLDPARAETSPTGDKVRGYLEGVPVVVDDGLDDPFAADERGSEVAATTRSTAKSPPETNPHKP